MKSVVRLLTRLRQTLASFICPELVEQRDQLEREANRDALTDVANRRALDRALPAAEADPQTAIVLLDANDFGLVNKRCGHATGDELLRQMARVIERVAQRFGLSARVFRAGGDEFVILASTQTAQRLRDEAEREFGEVTVCSGVRVSLSGTVGQTLREADRLLQTRKRTRKEAA